MLAVTVVDDDDVRVALNTDWRAAIAKERGGHGV
jgi:hypothetical protein